MTQAMTQMLCLPGCEPAKLLRNLVDLVGIEPTTSSMPWKRAPSCATGPLCKGRTNFYSRLAPQDSQTGAAQAAASVQRETSNQNQKRFLEVEHVPHIAGLIIARVQRPQAPVPLNGTEDGNIR